MDVFLNDTIICGEIMKIEEEIFYGYTLDEEKLTSFGFNYVDDKYIKEYKIHNDEFTALITIDKNSVNGKIIDNNFQIVDPNPFIHEICHEHRLYAASA